jgi:hypothetical protein
MNLGVMNSCRDSIRKLGKLPLQSQYIFSLFKKQRLFKMNSDVLTYNTRFNQDLHLPPVNLTVFQKGGWYSGIKLYNHLRLNLKQLYNIPKFKGAFQIILLSTMVMIRYLQFEICMLFLLVACISLF